MPSWTAREYTRSEAARVAGFLENTFGVVLHRTKSLEPLYSGRRKGRIWFSPKDITVLRVALELERAGRNWLTAIAQAFEHLEDPPPPEALLIVPVESTSCMSGRLVFDMPAPPSSSIVVIPIGRIAAETMEALDGLAV